MLKNNFMLRCVGLVTVFFLVLTALTAASRPAYAAACDSREMESMKSDLAALKKDMGEIKRVLISVLPALVGVRTGSQGVAQGAPPAEQARRQGPTTATVTLSGGESLGDRDAGIAIVEFSDFQCPFCARFHDEAFGKIRKDFVDNGKILFIYKDFPLSFHENAMAAALAARCAGDQGKYWKMHDVLFRNQRELSDLPALAKKAGLDEAAFKKCVKEKKHLDEVRANIEEGRKVGVRGTPTFVIGKVEDGKVTGVVVPGAAPYAVFRDRLNILVGKK